MENPINRGFAGIGKAAIARKAATGFPLAAAFLPLLKGK